MVKVVTVVMGDDFPAAVFDTVAAAEAYCEERREECKKQQPGMFRHIYWRTYDFILNNEDPTAVGRT